jgi:L-amino acid N-acyltransferase YncA
LDLPWFWLLCGWAGRLSVNPFASAWIVGLTSDARVILRDAKSGDLAAIAEILNNEIRSGTASWTETPKTADDMAHWFDDRIAGGYPVLVAEGRGKDDGAVLGYASYGPFRSGEGYRETVENSIYIARTARGRDIARMLMERLIAAARAAGYHRMVGGVSADQPASMALHRKFGFEEQGRLKGVGLKRGKRLDLAFMVLALDG